MMISGILSFFGGTAFRWVFGAVMEFISKRQEHQIELETMRLQSDLEAARHGRDLERIRLQSDLGVREVEIRSDAEERKAMADAFIEAVRATKAQTGIKWVDAWNASIRPGGATISIALWVVGMASTGWILNEFDKSLIGAFLGIFVGDRVIVNRNK